MFKEAKQMAYVQARKSQTLRSANRIVRRQLNKRKRHNLVVAGGAPPSFYDWAYSGAVDEYILHYSKSTYLPVWEAICERLPDGALVLEVGCGPAQFAQMLSDRQLVDQYVGFDFSPTAIDLAKKNVPDWRLEVGDARTTDLYTSVEYNSIVCTEVLEHIVDDILVLKRIPTGKQVLATVPNFDYESHVRFFANTKAVRERYGELFDSLEVTEHYHAGDSNGSNGIFFLLNGIRN